jgi:hypothetical protein
MYYYKVLDLQGQEIGLINSYSLLYYNETSQLMLNCFEDQAQYVCINNTIYRVPWLHNESAAMKGKYPTAHMRIIEQEEYETYMKNKTEKENLE